MRKDLLINLGLFLGSTLFCFVLVETAFRGLTYLEDQGISHTHLHQGIPVPEDGQAKLGHIIRRSGNAKLIYELKPDLEVTYHQASVRTNSLGMRSREIDSDDDAFTIVGIGDSFMFGQGVGEGEPYLTVLEELLEEAGHRVRVINLGVPGYNTVMEVESLRSKGLAYDPDLVIIEFVGNDLSLPNFVRAPRDLFDLERSYAADYFRHRLGWNWDKPDWKEMTLTGIQGIPMEDPQGMGRTTDPSKVPKEFRHLVGWDAYRGAMQDLLSMSEEEGFHLLLISLAPSDGLLKKEALRFGREEGIEVLDIGQVVRGELQRLKAKRYLGSPLALSETDGHPSARGHRLAGETLFDHLVQTNRLP